MLTRQSFEDHRTSWLRRYITIALPMVAPIVGIQVVATLMARTPATLAALVIEVFYAVMLIIARALIQRGRPARAAATASGGLVVVAVVAAFTNPEGLAILIQMPLLALLIAAPFLERRGLIVALAGAFAATLGIVAASALRPLPELAPITNIAILLATGVCTITILITLVQYHRWFTALLDDSQRANAELRQIRADLEQLVLQRTAQLAESETRHRIVSGLTSDLIVAYDVDAHGHARIAWVNDAFAQITGYTPEQLRGAAGAIQLDHPDDRDRVAAHTERLRAGATQIWDARIITAAGETRWMRNYAQPVRANPHAPVHQIIAAAQDITLQKQAEEAIRQQALQRAELLEIARQMLASRSLTELSGRVRGALQRLIPYDSALVLQHDPAAGQLRPQLALSVLTPEQSAAAPERPAGEGLAAQVIASGQPLLANHAPLADAWASAAPAHQIILPIISEAQTIGLIEISRQGAPYSAAEFELAELFGSFLSLAASNTQLLEQLLSSEQKYRRLFEESTDTIYISTPDGRVLDINPAGLELAGYTRAEILALDIAPRLYIDPAERAEFVRLMEIHGEVRGLISQRRRKDGQVITVEENARAIRDERGVIVQYQGHMRDITARRRAEQMLRQVVDGARCLLWSAVVEQREPAGAPPCIPAAPAPGQPRWIDHGLGSDLYWQFQFFNESSAGATLGISRAAGQSYADAWLAARLPEDIDRADALSMRAIGSGQPGYSQQFRIRCADGTIRWLAEEVQISPAGPGRWELIGVCTDVTEARESADQLSRQVAELQRHSAEIMTLNLMGERLQSARSERDATQATAEVLARLLPDHGGAIYTREPGAPTLRLAAAWGEPAAPLHKIAMQPCWADQAAHEQGACPSCDGAVALGGGSALPMPLYDRGQLAGLALIGDRDGHALADDQRTLLKAAIRPLELAITNLRLRETLRMQAIRDPLTGLYNRRYMEESLARELHRMARRHAPLGIVMLDLDHFKQINDRFGHAAGDTMLRELGQFMLAHVRAEDIACRYGGEEFILILPETTLEDTRRRADQICAQVRDLAVVHQQRPMGAVTVSIGVAAFPAHGETAEALLHEADMALYQAKLRGRNQVITAAAGGTPIVVAQ